MNPRNKPAGLPARIFVLLLLCGFAAVAAAQESAGQKPGTVADIWVLWPKAGHERDFEEGARQLLAWRKQAGDPFEWSGFVPIVGTDLSHYVFYSGSHRWADLDAMREWSSKNQAGQRFDQLVGPHLERAERFLSVDDSKLSLWKESEDYRYFQVTDFKLAPGARPQFRAAVEKVRKAAADGDWPRSWSIAWNIGGEYDGTVVWPYRSFADMADPEVSIMELMTKSLGSQEAARETMTQLQQSITKDITTVYAHRPELSTPE